MNSTSNIAFALAIGFLVFITVRGELPAYLCVVGLGSNCPAPNTTPLTTSSVTTSSGSSPVATSSSTSSSISSASGLPPSTINTLLGIGSPAQNPPSQQGTSSSTINYDLNDEGDSGYSDGDTTFTDNYDGDL